MFKRCKTMFGICMTSIVLFTACGGSQKQEETESVQIYIDQAEMDEASLEEEIEAVRDEAPIPQMISVEASGVLEERSEEAVIDYSNTAEGYVMVQYLNAQSKRLKVQVKGPTTTYTYNLKPEEWTTFPLSDGNGEYQVIVYENVVDNKYAVILTAGFSVELEDEFAPFIRPNQYVDYLSAKNTIAKSVELMGQIEDSLMKVEVVYDYVVGNISYDHDKASTVKSGYLPVLDEVLESGKGICFDYAALMTGMLRSQGVPCKLVVGYAGSVYHAWINVWSEETGWIDGVIYFDGKMWHRMDPTFASSANQSESIMEYIGDGTNYIEKYLY